MIKRLARASRISTALLMVVSVFVPMNVATVAQAAGSITKSVTVLGVDGQPYAGASVSIKYAPQSGSREETIYLPPVTTGANGVATLTFADNLEDGMLMVQPPVTDTVAATYTNYYDNFATSNPVTVNLEKRIATINITKPNGESVGPGAGIWLASNAFKQFVLGGNIGLSLDNNVETETCLLTEVFPPDSLQDAFYGAFGTKITGTGESRVLKFYNDADTCLIETNKVNGVYQLKLNPSNVSGYLRTNTGDPLTFPSGSGYKVHIFGLNQDGSRDNSAIASGSYTSNNGFWAGHVDTSTARTFELVFSSYGSALLPFFSNRYLYVTANGSLSLNADGSSATPTITNADFNIPAPNFTVRHLESVTGTLFSAGYLIDRKLGANSYQRIGMTSVIDTSTAVFFEDGDYRIMMLTNYGNLPTFEISVANSVITGGPSSNFTEGRTLRRQSGTNNFVIWEPVKNVRVKLVDGSGTTVAGRVDIGGIQNSQKVFFGGNTDSSGYVKLAVPDGTYIYSNITPLGSIEVGRVAVSATVTGGVLQLNVGTLESDGSWTVTLPTSNVKFSLKDAGNNPVEGDINFCNQDGCTNLGTNGAGQAGGVVPNGTYEDIWVFSGGAQNLGDLRLSGSVTNGVVSITGKSLTNGVYALQIPTANIKFNVTRPESTTAITSGYINFSIADSNWNQVEFYVSSNTYSNPAGYARAYLPDGRYVATVRVHTNEASNVGLAPKSYRVTVENGVPTVSYNGTNIPAVNGKFPVTPSAANLEVTARNLDQSPLTSGWLDVCEDIGGGETNSCRGYGFDSEGRVSQSLENGDWVIKVRPGESTTMSEKSYLVSVVNGVATVAGATLTSGRWILTGSVPNISGSFTLASGSLTFANNQGISLSLQKYNSGKDFWEWQSGGTYVRSQNYALNVTTAGRYRVVATPNNFPDLVQSYGTEFYVNGSSQVSLTSVGGYGNSLTAQAIRLKAPNLRLKVLNPIDNSLLPGGWVSIQRIEGQQRIWVSHADIQNSNPGLTGANLAEGQYVLMVNPPNGSRAIVGLAAREYRLTVAANESMTVTLGDTPVTIDAGRFVLAPATANITARIVKSDGSAFGNSNGKWINVNLQKFVPEKNYWEYTAGNAQGDQDGYVSLRVETAGTYRLRIEPNGDADSTVTYSSEFTLTNEQVNTFKKEFGNLSLAGPSIKVSVATASAQSTALENAGIEIRKDGNWIDWANTNRTGVAGINLNSEGTYEFIVNPPFDLQGSASRKSYTVTAVKDSQGVISATVTGGTGVLVSGSVTTLLLGTPTLRGTVLAPDPSTATQSNSQVYALNVNTGQEMWQYSTNTNSAGAWAMSLPAGTYKLYAKTPWGTSTFGGSDPVGNVVVNSSGVATTVPGGVTADAFTIRLKAPNWSGLVKNLAGTAVVPNARVCLRLNNIYNCVNADASGAWALSAPEGFTNFTGTDPYLEINDDNTRQYPQRQFKGIAAVTGAIGLSGSNKVLLFADANTQITITAGGAPVPNVWVSAERDGIGWLGGGSTNAQGVAKLNIDSSTVEFKVRVELNGNPTVSSSYASTMKTFTASQISAGSSGGVFSTTVALAEPNVKVVLREPTSDGSVGSVLPYAWIELYSDTTGSWLGGSSTDANGFASFKLDTPTTGINNFTLTANPAWNASTNYSRQAYAVAVSPTTITVVNKTTTAALSLQNVGTRSVYPLTLGTPSVTGVVVNPSGGTVANSWVVPRDAITSEYYWQQGVNSRNNGAIGLSLISGQYLLEANIPWGASNVAKSASCAVTVANGTISTGGDCVQVGTTKTVRLALRTPNVTFTLKAGGVAVANANVGIGAGKWHTNAQSDSEGNVSLFIDADAIRAANNSTTAQPLQVWVDPPYGSSVEMARWDCQSTQAKPICSGLVNVPATGDYPTRTLGDVTGVAPNTRVRVVAPSTTDGLPNSWIAVFAFDPANLGNGNRWLGGGNSNSSGNVSMNLETSTVPSGWKFAIEINAPWNQRQNFATKMDNNGGNGYSWAEITNLPDVSPASPNLVVTVNSANAIANKFGWIGIEEVNESNNPIKWVGGYGLNENGLSSIFLASSKKFRITAYPGPGKSGARTLCVVATAINGLVSEVSGACSAGNFSTGAVTIALDGGNVVGTVTRASDGSLLVGAIVYANIPTAVDESTAVITSTGADGRYGLQLDPNQTWDIKVFPSGSGISGLAVRSETGITPPQSGAQSRTLNFSIAAA